MFSTIRAKLLALMVVVIAAMVVVVSCWWVAFNTLKVNGPVYTEIVQVKDLVADILPPPEYILESYLVAAKALDTDPAGIPALKARMDRLKADYLDRHAFWTAAHLPAAVADGLLDKSYAPAMTFYDIADTTFLPALARGDRPAAQAAFKDMTAAYETHRAAIDAVVAASDRLGKDTEASAAASEHSYKLLVSTLSLAMTAVAMVVLLLVLRAITRPINAMTGVMGQLAANALSVEVPFADRDDEVGAMAKAVNTFKNQLIRVKQMEADQEEQKRRAEADRLAAMRKMADGFEGSVGKVIETVTEAATGMQAASGMMAASADRTSTQAGSVAASAQQASANVQTVASATEELAASIKEIAHQVERSQTVSSRAGDEAHTTTTQIRALSDNVGKIGEIVNLINDIAAQTNLLALNATIEAARAGEAGKGFAVVANEVKGLANQTARATSEIASQIQAVQEGTNAAVHAIDSISKVIGEMAEISSAVAAAVEQQTAATSEIARNVEQAAAGTKDVSASIAAVEEAAQETGAGAEQINESAADLSRQAEILRHEVRRFLTQVRADKKDMALLTWNPDLAMGVPSIDSYHQGIFERLNEFYRQMMSGDGGKAAIAMLAELSRTVQDHFAEEEALMAKQGYPAAADHRRRHQAFLERLAGQKAAVEADQPGAVPQLFDYVAGWIDGHVRNDDKALAEFLRGKRAA